MLENQSLEHHYRWAAGNAGKLAVVVVGALAGFAGLVSLFYATSIQSAAGTSDKATTILVGQAVRAGHLLLHGWTLPPGNYWTTDVAYYAIAVRLFGLHPSLLFSEPAVVAAVTVLVGILLSIDGRRRSAALAGGVTVFALLVFAPPAMALWFVGNGFHIMSALYGLVAFAVLARVRFGLAWVFAVALLAFGMLGDLEIAAFAIIPVLLGGLSAAVRRRDWRSGAPQISASLVAGLLGEVGSHVAIALGAFKRGPALPIAHLSQMATNLSSVFVYGADLLGITNGRFGTAGVPRALLGVHVVGGIAVVACLLVTLFGLCKGLIRGGADEVGSEGTIEPWRLDDLLLFGVFGSTALFVVLAGANGLGVHFLSVPVLFASVLTGRVLARGWSAVPTGWISRSLALAGLSVVLVFGAGLANELSRPAPPQPVTPLIAVLGSHHLRSGIGGYWTSAITTVESSGAIVIRPVGIGINGTIERMMSQSSTSWYSGQKFQFFVSDLLRSGRVQEAAAIRTWGNPVHRYVVGSFRVLVWSHMLSLSALTGPSS